jgi:hypothetical protein
MTFTKGDKVVGLGRCGARWPRKPVGTVTKVHGDWVRVQWDANAVEDDMAPADLLTIYRNPATGRWVTIPERDEEEGSL